MDRRVDGCVWVRYGQEDDDRPSKVSNGQEVGRWTPMDEGMSEGNEGKRAKTKRGR